jgi:hypothetical protein
MHSLVRKSKSVFVQNMNPWLIHLGAKGTRSQDGAWFIIEITTADGKWQSFEWEYPLLKLVCQLLQPRRSRLNGSRSGASSLRSGR